MARGGSIRTCATVRPLWLDYAGPGQRRPAPFLLLAGLFTSAGILLFVTHDFGFWNDLAAAFRDWTLSAFAPCFADSAGGVRLFFGYYFGELSRLAEAVFHGVLLGIGMACLIVGLRPRRSVKGTEQAGVLAGARPGLVIAKHLVLHRHRQRRATS